MNCSRLLSSASGEEVGPASLALLDAQAVREAPPPPGLVFFNSTGLGVQDAAAAAMVLQHVTGTAPRP